jgi:catechol 2,3-dioxygenase-like lactoylglutathione lyase family enzyme
VSAFPILRVARPTNDLVPLRRFYVDGAGFQVLAAFEGHAGFDGLIVGHAVAPWHLEFVVEDGVRAPRAPSGDHLLVLYLPDREVWRSAGERMQREGFAPVSSHNPYWDRSGLTFEDPDGYRLVLENAAWSV